MYRSCAQIPSSSGFTAINQHRLQLVSTLQSSIITQSQQNQTKLLPTGKSSRRRNPTVALYLGLGDPAEPAHLAKYASVPDGHPPQSSRKRRAQPNSKKTYTGKRANTENRKTPIQKRISEDLCVTKYSTQSIPYKLEGSTEEHLPTPNYTAVLGTIAPAIERPQTNREGQLSGNIIMKKSHAPLVGATRRHAVVSTDDDKEFDQLCFEFEPHDYATDNSAHPSPKPKLTQCADSQFNMDDFDDDLMDDDLLDLTRDMVDGSSSFELQSSSPTKIDVADERLLVTQTSGTSAGNAVVPNQGRKKFVSPVTLSTRLLAATGGEARKPIVRPAFPGAVRDRSPIIGLSSKTVLKTCFRVGEAINQSCQANKNGNSILVELYTRVLHSERDDVQQRFTFGDLFHAKPPYIQAVYAAAIWKTVQLFEHDGARVLQQGTMCRCIGTMKREGKKWVMNVLNVWEATWDDVQWVEGIVSS